MVVTSAQPGALLPTILSRVLAMRVRPVPAEAIRAYLEEELGTGPADAERISVLARGAVGRAIRLATEDEEGGGSRAAARELLIAALSAGAVPRYAAAGAQRPFGGRGGFAELLDALAEWLRDLLAVASGAQDEVADPGALELLRRAVERRSVHPLGVASAIERVARAQLWAQGNVNPQMILADLLRGMQTDLLSPPDSLPTL